MANRDAPPAGHDSTSVYSCGQTLLGRYRLDRLLAHGAMGNVWLAQDEKLDRPVALKIFLEGFAVGQSYDSLRHEANRSLELSHPNIIRTFDFVRHEQTVGLAMEYAEGGSVRNWQREQPHEIFEPVAIHGWMQQLCEALDYAHLHASIIHRDLRPANLLLDGTGQLKVAGFGFASHLAVPSALVDGEAASVGTLVYASPQQLAGARVNRLDDIYALGATVYELCTRTPPFYSGDILSQVRNKIPPSMAERRSSLRLPAGELPAPWEATVAACLAKDPADRPQSAGEVAARLGFSPVASISSPTVPILRPLSAVATAMRARWSPVQAEGRRRQSPTILVMAIGAVLLICCVAAWVVGGRPADDEKSPSHADRDARVEASRAPATSRTVPEAAIMVKFPSTAASLAPVANGAAILLVKSEPPGAMVKVDGQRKDRTPALLENLVSGKHTVSIDLVGYEEYSEELELGDSKPVSREITLERSTGWLDVNTNDPSAEISVRGPENPAATNGTWKSDKLPVGDYIISAQRVGAKPMAKTISVTRGELSAVSFDLNAGEAISETDSPDAAPITGSGGATNLAVEPAGDASSRTEHAHSSTRSSERRRSSRDEDDRPGTGIGHKIKSGIMSIFGGSRGGTPAPKRQLR